MTKPAHPIVNVDEVDERLALSDTHPEYGQAYKPLTPLLDAKPGRLGINQTRLPPGRVACPFHYHQREDEAFFVLSGRGLLRYGEHVYELRAGDCVSCPAGARTAHQLANPFDEDLVYLAIGPNDPDEVCVYPDSGKVMVRSLGAVGAFEKKPYMEAEPSPPRVLSLPVTPRA